MKILIVLVATCAVLYSEAKPAQFETNVYDDFSREYDFGRAIGDVHGDGIAECHGIICPSGTVACSKKTQTSADKRTLLTTVQCEDLQGNILNSETKSSENPFENTQISSFSFTGHYNYNSNTGSTSNGLRRPPTYQNTYYNNNNDEVETFA